MHEWTMLVLAGAAGIAAGTFFFAGLRWTVARALASSRTAWWLLGSFLLRLSLVLAVIDATAQDHWQRMLAALVGILIARAVVLRRARYSGEAV
jgi:F1F0 ATPase subunit 2